MTDAVTRWVRGYDRMLETLNAEYPLPRTWSLERLQELFGVSKEDPMYDCYPIGISQAAILGASLGHDLLTEGQDFFLEADAEEE